MADLTTKTVLSLCATTGSRLPDLAIKNGQLIFVRDKRTIAFDFGGVRTFYNQIEVLDTDEERNALSTPVSGIFYFVIDTAILWFYQDKWIPITTPPQEVVFIGTELPELGKNKIIYIDKVKKNISVWDEETSSYVIVGEKIDEISAEEIDALFQI